MHNLPITEPPTIINGVHLMLCTITFCVGFLLGAIYGYLEGRDTDRRRRR